MSTTCNVSITLCFLLDLLDLPRELILLARPLVPGEFDPWSKPMEICLEEEDTPEPTAFGESILYYMETSHEEAREDYFCR